MKTKKLVTLGILAALAVVLIMVTRTPIIPNAPFLKYEAGDVPMLIAALIYGPIAGLIVTVIASIIQTLTFDSGSGIIGLLMHIIASGTLIVVSSLIFTSLKKRNISNIISLIIALSVGVLSMTLIMIPCNMIFWPLFAGTPLSEIMPILIPAILPFNLLKAGINSIAAFIIYISIKKYIMAYFR